MHTPPLTCSNKKSSAVKRILSEARELEADGSDEYEARPLEVSLRETQDYSPMRIMLLIFTLSVLTLPVEHLRMALHASRAQWDRI